MQTLIKVTHYQRKPELGAFSLERLFADIRAVMPSDIAVDVQESTFLSRGLWRRTYNIIEAAFRQGDVNHVTGDVHFLAYLLKRKRTILTILDCVSLQRLSRFKRWVLWLLWYALPVSRADLITVISEATKQELLKVVHCDLNKVHVIYCCISEWFNPEPLLFNTCCPRILQVGTGDNKNIERVTAALSDINCQWIIIGRLSPAQRAVIESHGIEYENHVGLSEEALLEQYKLADMLVFASTYEGFGLPIVEANAVGRPVVTSTLYSMPEVAGNAACLVDPYSIASIRAGILKVIEDADYRGSLVRAGFINVERFRPAVIAEQYAQLYRKIADINRL